ncbi:hypothetical protein [Edaphovirga cremea]|uniref:hypothetical protein n=1 Tax=Edaphovirga cremea TaxID=2267246 RepID=UPI0039897A7D
MLYSYRVTKYFQSDINNNLISVKNEWTSFSDVGVSVTMENYVKIEKSYLEVISSLCSYLKVDKLQVFDLECFDDLSLIADGQLLTIEEATVLASRVLREEIWCKLISSSIEFHFGYDFYMYVVSNVDLSQFLSKINCNEILNIHEYMSPYL